MTAGKLQPSWRDRESTYTYIPILTLAAGISSSGLTTFLHRLAGPIRSNSQYSTDQRAHPRHARPICYVCFQEPLCES